MEDLLTPNTKLLVTHRRLYPTDEPRFFVGTVVGYADGIMKVFGRTFIRDMGTGEILPKREHRTKFLSLASGLIFVYELPETVSLESLRFQVDESQISVVDGRGFSMDLAEHHHD